MLRYAVTVHTAQGVTAETTHAVLGENTSRALLYVAMIRSRESNQAYLYERIAGETEHEHADPPGVHVMRRGSGRDAAQLVRAIIANHDEQARTAHHIAARTTDRDQLPDRVHRLLDRRAEAVQRQRAAYRHWHEETQELVAERQRWIDQHRHRSHDRGLDYGIDRPLAPNTYFGAGLGRRAAHRAAPARLRSARACRICRVAAIGHLQLAKRLAFWRHAPQQ